jgi:DNA ligase (NAD+)
MKINRENKVIHLDESSFNPSALTGKSIAITGTLVYFSRKDIQKTITTLGGVFASSVSKNVDMLIYGEKAGSKLEQAKSLGIKIVTEEEFLDLILK